MSATFTKSGVQNHRGTGKMLSVVGLYHDSAAREQLLAITDRLAARFAAEFDFDCHWWRIAFLNNAVLAAQARREAGGADIVLIGCGQAEDFSFSLLNWFEDWVAERAQPDGVLLHLLPPEAAAHAVSLHTRFYFQDIAQRARMDYLTGTSESITRNPPTRFGMISLKSTTLSVIVTTKETELPPPSHFGLNE